MLSNVLKKFSAIKHFVLKQDKLPSEDDVHIINNLKPDVQGIDSRSVPREHFDSPLIGFVPPGHYYSPIPSIDEIKKDETLIFSSVPRELPGIDLCESEQLILLNIFKEYYRELPFKPDKNPEMRYYLENPAYPYSDGIFLYCMIRYLKPKRIIEIGSGYSSCAILDTNELFFADTIVTTFIDPYPERFLSLIKKKDLDNINVFPCRLQDVDPREFEVLERNDILFIDSTHVSKVNSDVNHIFFDILPRLAPGVHIHFHDIFYPFEYPKEWIYGRVAWNETYILKAFLQYNNYFRIVFMNTFLEHFYEPIFLMEMPLCLKNKGGSIWLARKE